MTDDYTGDTGDEGTDDSDLDDEGESEGTDDSKSSDKRIGDLQSKADKETARANKAEKENQRLQGLLKAALAEGSGDSSSDDEPPAGDGGVLDMARMFVYQQHPKLAEYGIPASDLSGSTPTQIAESAVAVVARLEKIETKARNKLLADNGMAPEIDSGSPPPPKRDFTKMSKEEFEKVMDEALHAPRA